MDLMTNEAFRIIGDGTSAPIYEPGIYRVILSKAYTGTTVAVLIDSDNKDKKPRTGRKKKADELLARKRKKAPPPLVGKLVWMETAELATLHQEKLLKKIEIERENVGPLSESNQADYDRRLLAMAGFLDAEKLTESILMHRGLSGLVADAMAAGGVSAPFVYKQWSALCRQGLVDKSLTPRRDRCGGQGIARPSDPGGRKKAGRKTLKQRIALAYGVALDPEQPGMSSEWAAAVRAADRAIPTPKPSWPTRCDQIVSSAFCARAKEVDGKLELIKPAEGLYPNDRQIQHALTFGTTRLARLLETTTKRHFTSAMRGLVARSWQGVAGPGHTWMIDSTVGDIYLRSSVNRAWIVGRPIVYVLVDVWSTAVVGFYVCLTGPSWNTAKVSLFNAAADPLLVGEMWGYQALLALDPAPTMCYALMCDRGEYLSRAHRETAIKMLPMTSYAPPYRGDLKGLVEVLHRIEKDAQFLFLPGAMDFRRKELELRKIDPATCVFTVREYMQYLYELFFNYNLTADRTHRLDAHMTAAGVRNSPAGLWHYGHQMGIGYQKHIPSGDLITHLLPGATARVKRDSVHYAGCDYTSTEVTEKQWTAIARNFGGFDIPVNYYPGAMGPLWTPNHGSSGLLRLQLSDQSRASPELTREEWADVLALQTMRGAGNDHKNKMNSLDSLERITALRDRAVQLTAEAIADASGKAPTTTEARLMEVAATAHPSRSESVVRRVTRDEAMEEHERMMAAVLEGR
jgi:putative transposase